MRAKLAIALCLVAPLLAGKALAADTLTIGGTGSATELLRQVGAKFTTASEVKIDVIPSLGSSGAIRALADGKLDIAVSARPLKPAEVAQGLSQTLVLRTAYVLATSHSDPKGFKASDFPKIFMDAKAVWADGTPLRIILRPRSETDTQLLADLFPGMDVAIEAARKRPEVPTAATDQDNAKLAEQTPGALIGISLAQIAAEHRKLHVVSLDNVEPTLANFESGVYRFSKKLYFVLRIQSTPEAQRFVKYLRSPQGISALHEFATLPGAD
jgi:phosphate transport system substrate-binding protein